MDRQRVREREAQCTQEWPPACAAACPVHVDARGLIERVRGGDLAGGLALFAATVPFPRIIGRICDRPCERACKRRDAGDAVRINALERACVERAGIAPRRIARSGARTQRVAVVGAGLSGLTAAVDLAGKGYRVVVFEADARAGGRLRQVPAEVLPDAAIEADLEVLPGLGIELRCGVRVGNGPDVLVPFDGLTLEFDAVYLGPGPGSVRALRLGLAEVDGERLRIDPLTFATSAANVFAGGGQRYAGAFSPITSLQDGRYAAVSVDRFLQQASLTAARDRQGPFATRLFTSTRDVAPRPVTPAADAALGYTTAEAVQEAERCLSCQCLECVKACEYLKHYGSYPKRYVRQIYNNDCIVMGARPLNRMVNSCALCGLCATVCPEKLSMGEVSREARRSMVVKGKMPASVHEFALRDMAFSAGEHFSLSRHEPGHSSSAALFFPGCQLSASSPDHVVRLYEHLRGTIPGGVGLHLGCCGAPADWAAREDLLAAALEELAATWERMGNPRVITACASCHRLLRERLPAARVESVWPLLAELGIPGGAAPPPARLAVHDPCATRDVPEVQQSVRRILARLGVEVVELEHGRETTTCCGYGGLMTFADPALADQVVARRIAEADTDYLAYCAMCRDRFASKGKRTLHLLDLLLGSSQADPGTRERPTYSERHENRARLKARLLRDVWRERPADAGRRPMELDVSPEVRALLERRMILVEDVASVIANAEATGEKLQDVASGHLLAAYRPVTVTYRVEYSVLPDRVVVHNAYSHRMEVTPGATT